VSAAAFATAGRRGEDRMEDAHVLASPLPVLEDAAGREAAPGGGGEARADAAHALAVFDGHRGAAAARFAAAHLLAHLRGAWAAPSAASALAAAFARLDVAFREAEVLAWLLRVHAAPVCGWGRRGAAPGCLASRLAWRWRAAWR